MEVHENVADVPRWYILTEEGLSNVYLRRKTFSEGEKIRVEVDGMEERGYYSANVWTEERAVRDFFVTKAVLAGGRMLVDRQRVAQDLKILLDAFSST
jgi:hypothetical protein